MQAGTDPAPIGADTLHRDTDRPVVDGRPRLRNHPTGAREWYQTPGWRWVTGNRASIDGEWLGRPGPLTRPIDVGISEPPRRPSIVAVRVTIELS